MKSLADQKNYEKFGFTPIDTPVIERTETLLAKAGGGTTIIFEVLVYFIKYVLYSTNIEVLNFIEILIVEVIYNILITIIIYPLIQKFGYYIENTYKGNKILTRYF